MLPALCWRDGCAYLEIRADHDANTIIVYQAFRPEIVDAAVAARRFVPPFSLGRMTWIKPSFLWMMERSGWATKAGQERVVAVRITRAGWEEALAAARLSSQDTSEAAVVVQWDPERNVRGTKLQHRAIQVGLASPDRQALRRRVDDRDPRRHAAGGEAAGPQGRRRMG